MATIDVNCGDLVNLVSNLAINNHLGKLSKAVAANIGHGHHFNLEMRNNRLLSNY
jgi:hypothetical protein